MSISCIDFPVSSISSFVGADNGLSIDPVTGNVVWGNDVGDATDPAALLSNRFIEFGDFDMIFSDVVNSRTLTIDPISLLFDDTIAPTQTTVQAGVISVLSNDGSVSINAFPGFAGTIDLTTLIAAESMINFIDGLVGITLKSSLGVFDISEYGVASSRHLIINPITEIYQFGDIDAIASGLTIDINATVITNTLSVFDNVGTYLQLDIANGLYRMGDIDNIVNGTRLRINDIAERTTIADITGEMLVLDRANGIYIIGNDDIGNQVKLRIDDAAQVAHFQNAAISTSDPGSGIGLWKLGQFTVGAVALDSANYIEVEIDGTIRKLLIST